MGYDIPDWLLSSMFHMGLHIKLEPYIFHLAQGARTAKKILTVDEMVTAFADHDRRHPIYLACRAFNSITSERRSPTSRNSICIWFWMTIHVGNDGVR
jgi:hypothetical protein